MGSSLPVYGIGSALGPKGSLLATFVGSAAGLSAAVASGSARRLADGPVHARGPRLDGIRDAPGAGSDR